MRCPYCRRDEFWRMASPRWMKRAPGLHNLRCSNCGREFAILFGCIRLRHSRAREITRYWMFFWLALAFVAIGLLIVQLMRWQHMGVL